MINSVFGMCSRIQTCLRPGVTAVLPGAGAGMFRGAHWRLRADQFTEIFRSRVSQVSYALYVCSRRTKMMLSPLQVQTTCLHDVFAGLCADAQWARVDTVRVGKGEVADSGGLAVKEGC